MGFRIYCHHKMRRLIWVRTLPKDFLWSSMKENNLLVVIWEAWLIDSKNFVKRNSTRKSRHASLRLPIFLWRENYLLYFGWHQRFIWSRGSMAPDMFPTLRVSACRVFLVVIVLYLIRKGAPCPENCLCYRTQAGPTVRCNHHSLARIPIVPPTTVDL